MPRILIVDDDQAMRKLLRFQLKDAYEIIDTGSPEEALALALQHKPDAILLDLMMPNCSGFELCQALTSMTYTESIPVFIISGESAKRYKEYCRDLGAQDFFQKPIDFAALNARLKAVLSAKRIERRSEPRVRLRAKLKLRETAKNDKPLEVLTVTENIGAHGFQCACNLPVTEGAIVEVSVVTGGAERFAGNARVTRVEWPNTPGQTCGFRFVEIPRDWIL